MSEIDEVRAAGRRVLKTLRDHSPDSGYSAAVAEAVDKLDDPAQRLEAVKTLHGLSHIKALGDIYLPGVPGYEWPNLVSQLSATTGSYIRQYDPNRPIGRELGYSKEELMLLTKTALPTHVHEPPDIRGSKTATRLSIVFVFVAKYIALPVAVVSALLLLVK